MTNIPEQTTQLPEWQPGDEVLRVGEGLTGSELDRRHMANLVLKARQMYDLDAMVKRLDEIDYEQYEFEVKDNYGKQYEVYTLVNYQWDAFKAKQLIAARPKPHSVYTTIDPVKVWKDIGILIRTEEKYVLNGLLDLTVPVIQVSHVIGGTVVSIIIDGNHRIWMAAALGLKQLPVFVLSPEETFKVFMGRYNKTEKALITNAWNERQERLRKFLANRDKEQ